MSWNYRIIESKEDGEIIRQIHEVFYDDDGNPEMHGINPAIIIWNEDEEGGAILEMMNKAFDLPVLTEEDFES